MVFHIATGVNQALAFKFFKHLGRVFAQNIHQDIKPATVGHGHYNFFAAVFPRATHQAIEQWNQALAPLKTKALGARVLGVQMLLQPLSCSKAAQHINTGLITIGGLGAHRLKALGQPLLLSKAGDMHKFWAQMAAVSLFQCLDNLAQSCLGLAHIQWAGLKGGI